MTRWYEQFRGVQNLSMEKQEQEVQITGGFFISGEKIILSGIVENILDLGAQVQPAGIDFTLKRISSLESTGVIDFDNTKRRLPAYKEIIFGDDDTVYLQSGVYLIEFNETVSVPVDILGIMRTRSSVFRSGAILTAGVIDPGYKGAVGALLQVWNTHGITLLKNAKVVQWVFAKVSEHSEEGYTGTYKDAKSIF